MPAESPQDPNEPNIESRVTQNENHWGGRILRFIGMLLIVWVIIYSGFFLDISSVGEFIVLLFIGSAGAAIHFKGRKLAPGKHWASVRGGLFAVFGPLILGVLVVFALIGLLSDSGFIDAIDGALRCFSVGCG